MGAPSFSFKQFTVFHDKCAMKVGTDGVLLGAWSAIEEVNSILDIGTGSGLIALMLAQRCNADITAIDIDQNAIDQAKINFSNSPWCNRIELKHIDLSHFSEISEMKYDLIVSNPPFFKNSLQTPDSSRTIARHATENFHQQIILTSIKLLSEQGRLCIILPSKEALDLKLFAEKHNFHCNKITHVLPKPNAEAKRILLEFGKEKKLLVENSLVIETTNRHEYSDDFIELVKDFYLKL